MRLQVQFPIRSKLFLLMGTLVVFSIVTYLVLAIKLFRDDKTTLIYELNASSARTLSLEFRAHIQSLIVKSNLLAQGHRNNEWVTTLMQGESDIVGFSLFKKESDSWARLVFIDHSKVYREQRNLSEEDYKKLHDEKSANPSYLERAEKAGFWIGVPDREKLPSVMTISRQVSFESMKEPMIAVIDISLHRFEDQIRKTGIANLAIVTGDGTALLASNASFIGSPGFAAAAFVQEALRSPVALEIAERELEGVKILGAYADVGLGGLKVLSWVPSDQVYRASFRLINKSILFGLFLITIGLGFGAWVARGLTYPLQRLVKATEAIESWTFTDDLVVKSRDEVGALARAFTHMGRSLKLQRERTDDLQLKLVLSERLAAVGQVARGVGHEFGNILTRVVGKMDLAIADSKDEKTKAHLTVALEALDRASQILHNLRQFSKRESKFDDISVLEVIRQAKSLMHHETKLKSISWVEDLEYQGKIQADAVQLGQVFLNLMINATHAMPNGGEIRIRTRDRGDKIEIDVEDTGTGIPPDVLPRIFEPTFTTKGDQGTGLGLSVSSEIVDQHGGEIKVKSEVGKGTCFTLVLWKMKPEKKS